MNLMILFCRFMHFRNRAMSSDTFILRIPSADVPRDLKDEIQGVLADLAPLVTARIKEKRQTDFKSLIDVLLRGVKLRTLDIHRAQQQAKALEAVLENSEWLTAEEIGERGKFSPSNLAAPANRWKRYWKIRSGSPPRKSVNAASSVRATSLPLQTAGSRKERFLPFLIRVKIDFRDMPLMRHSDLYRVWSPF